MVVGSLHVLEEGLVSRAELSLLVGVGVKVLEIHARYFKFKLRIGTIACEYLELRQYYKN